MKHYRWLLARLGILAVGLVAAAAPAALVPLASSDSALLFTSFRKNGEDGLHLLWSTNAYTWTTLRHDQSWLKPVVGGGLMRDPNLIQGPDGVFHLVWTTAWNKHGLGYAHSKAATPSTGMG